MAEEEKNLEKDLDMRWSSLHPKQTDVLARILQLEQLAEELLPRVSTRSKEASPLPTANVTVSTSVSNLGSNAS